MFDSRLKTFIAVAENKNFSKAAAYLHLSQPAVSVQIQQLEEEYGTRLFKRWEKEVTLTPAGEVLLGYAYRILGLYKEAAREINRLEKQVRGPLHLGATLTIGEYLLPPVMGAFKQQFPQVDILLRVANTQLIEKMVKGRQIDLALVEGPLATGGLTEENLMSDELVLVCAPEHRWAGQETISWGELKLEKLLLREPGSGTREVFEAALENSGRSVNDLTIFMELGSTQAIKALVRENLGVTVISRLTVKEELAAGTLKALTFSDRPIVRSLRFVYLEGQVSSLVCESFMQFCQNYVQRGK